MLNLFWRRIGKVSVSTKNPCHISPLPTFWKYINDMKIHKMKEIIPFKIKGYRGEWCSQETADHGPGGSDCSQEITAHQLQCNFDLGEWLQLEICSSVTAVYLQSLLHPTPPKSRVAQQKQKHNCRTMRSLCRQIPVQSTGLPLLNVFTQVFETAGFVGFTCWPKWVCLLRWIISPNNSINPQQSINKYYKTHSHLDVQ